MDDISLSLRLLLLLGVANSTPILLKRALGTRWNLPLDAGQHLDPDDQDATHPDFHGSVRTHVDKRVLLISGS